jgi:hypothetical protein
VFLAGESLESARAQPTPADLERQGRTGRYWWSGLKWWMSCDECGRVHPYQGGGWKPKPGAGNSYVCRSGCPRTNEQLVLS